MTTQEILASLSQLETELEAISSARLLAEKTVTAYKEVQGEIRTFFSEFKKVSKSLNTISKAFDSEKATLTSDVKATVEVLKGQLDTLNKSFADQCNSIVLGFVNGSKEASEDFKTKIDTISSEYELNNETLKKRITDLASVQSSISDAISSVTTLKSDIALLQGQLNDSQKQQDATLESIAKQLKATGDNQGLVLSKLSDDLKKSQDAQDDDLDELKKVQKDHADKLESVLKQEEKLISGIDLIISTINEKIGTIDRLLTAVKQNVDSCSTKLDAIQSRQTSMQAVVEQTARGVSGLSNKIDANKSETNGKIGEVYTLLKSSKSMMIVNIIISIIVLLVVFAK